MSTGREKMNLTAGNRVKAGIARGIEAVVKAINTHTNNFDMCRAGCGALSNITKDNGKTTDKTAK